MKCRLCDPDGIRILVAAGLPAIFSLGWLAARIDIKHVHPNPAPAGFLFQGAEFLLNEQQDKAIESFIEVVREPETVELHFALGSLFRRRGEVERAIRMHQHLVERRTGREKG